ncbi:MAG: MBL fold metallo-hydrolase [Burkholderiales bacterium]
MLRRLAAAAGAALTVIAGAAPARDFSKVEIRSRQLAERVWMLTGAGGNLGLFAGEDAVFLVDDQYAPLTERIVAAVRRVTPRPVRFVVNTHWHGDHTGGNEALGKAGALVVAHDNVRKRMGTEQFIEFLGARTEPSPKGALPVLTFSADTTFHLDGEEIRAFHVPRAHTDGDAIVHFPASDVIHMGDVHWNGMYPFIDYSSGGTVDGMVAAVDRALALATERTRIIPGHGPLATRADLAAYRDMLATIAGRVRRLAAEGRSVEEIVAAKVTEGFDERWGKGFVSPQRFAGMVAKSLGEKSP